LLYHRSNHRRKSGAGSVYGTCVGNALKWFSGPAWPCCRRRPRPGFGAGAAITVVPIANVIAATGYEHAFFTFGIGQWRHRFHFWHFSCASHRK